MKIVTKKIKVFEFKELSKEVKIKVIEKWYENEQYPFLTDNIQEELKYLDKFDIFSDIKLLYSLSWSKGDGLSFSGEINLKNFLDNLYSFKLSEWKKRALNGYIYKIASKGNTGRYCYPSKSDIIFDYNYQDKEYKYLDLLFDKVLNEIKEYYLIICNKLEKCGYTELEYRMDNKEFQELCESNEYEFLENGNMF